MNRVLAGGASLREQIKPAPQVLGGSSEDTHQATPIPEGAAPVRRRNTFELSTRRGGKLSVLDTLRWMLKCEQADVEDLEGVAGYEAEWEEAVRMRDMHLKNVDKWLMEHGDGGPLLTITLDHFGSALVREHLAEYPSDDPRDALNACVEFMLWNPEGQCSPYDSLVAVARAKERRLAKEPEGLTIRIPNLDGKSFTDVELPGDQSEQLRAYAQERGLTLPQAFRDLLWAFFNQRHAETLSVTLDPVAAALVRAYLTLSPWDYSADDVASGSVITFLETVFDNQPEAERMEGLNSPNYHDGEWGMAERAFDEAQARKSREDEAVEGNHSTGRGRHTGTPADVALLAAAKPESVEADEEPLPEEEHVDEDEDDDGAAQDGKEVK